MGGKCTGRKTGSRQLNSVLTKIHRPKGILKVTGLFPVSSDDASCFDASRLTINTGITDLS